MTMLIKTLATAAAAAVLATGALAQSAGDAGNPPVFFPIKNEPAMPWWRKLWPQPGW